jgi:hypothetical protein
LFVGDTEVSGRLFQASQKRLKRLIKLAELLIGQRLPMRVFQFLLRSSLFFA